MYLFLETRSPLHATSLAEVSEDVLLLVGEACSSPLAPKDLAHLATTSCQILTMLRPKLNELRGFRAELRALFSKARSPPQVSSLAEQKSLVWCHCVLAPADITVFGRLLRSGALWSLTELMLAGNQIGDEGMMAFSTSIASGSLASLETLGLHNNKIGDEGMKVFSTALSSGVLASLQTLWLSRNQIGDEGMKAFSGALSSGAMGSLQKLYLNGNQIGGAGMAAFAEALKPNPSNPMGAMGKLTV